MTEPTKTRPRSFRVVQPVPMAYKIHKPRMPKSLPPYPKDTRGFLYYHYVSGAPTFVGELRFRVIPCDFPPPSTPEECVEGFKLGKDLTQRITGLPWRYYLPKLVHDPHFSPIVGLLLSDRIITPEIVERVKSFGQGKKRLLWAYGQPWALNFRDKALTWDIVSEQGSQISSERARILLPSKMDRLYPFNGALIVT